MNVIVIQVLKSSTMVVLHSAHYLDQYLMVTNEVCRYLAFLSYIKGGSQLLEVWKFSHSH